jgi:hypothetical protein
MMNLLEQPQKSSVKILSLLGCFLETDLADIIMIEKVKQLVEAENSAHNKLEFLAMMFRANENETIPESLKEMYR